MAWAAIAVGAISAVGKIQGAKQAKQIGQYNAQMTMAETNEAARRLANDQKRTEATMRARAAASGASVESKSFQLYADSMRDAHRRDMEWLRISGRSHADLAKWEAGHAATQGYLGAFGDIIGGIGGWWNA